MFIIFITQLKEITSKSSKLDETLKNKEKELQLSEQNGSSFVKLVEDQKKKIQLMTLMLNEKGKGHKDDKIKMLIIEKDTEIINLKNLLKSLKSELTGEYLILI